MIRTPLKAGDVRKFSYLVYQRGDCWEWRGNRNSLGYGMFFSFELGRSVLAHRFAYHVAKGPVSPSLELDHLCRHPWCVKPSHLEAVTHQENMCRGGNAQKKTCKRGHPLVGANVYQDPKGFRRCRQCKKDSKNWDARLARKLARTRYMEVA